MPRDPRVTTVHKLIVAQSDYEQTKVAAKSNSERRRKAIVAAVNAGNSKEAVARVAHTSGSRISQIIRETEE